MAKRFKKRVRYVKSKKSSKKSIKIIMSNLEVLKGLNESSQKM